MAPVLHCGRSLVCGHTCGGIRNEDICPPCLDTKCFKADPPMLNAECPICLDSHDEKPSIQLKCGHIYHYECINAQIDGKWTTRRMSFEFLNCALCRPDSIPIEHHFLEKKLGPWKEMHRLVKTLALERLKDDNSSVDVMTLGPVKDITTRFYQKPEEYAMSRYAYYPCPSCSNPCFGGSVACDEDLAEAQTGSDDVLCLSCKNTKGALVCEKHGFDNTEFKCSFCCSKATQFCFGNTFFCDVCHDNWQTLTIARGFEVLGLAVLPQCPVGPGCVQLNETDPCPLGLVNHAPTGHWVVLGCTMCKSEELAGTPPPETALQRRRRRRRIRRRQRKRSPEPVPEEEEELVVTPLPELVLEVKDDVVATAPPEPAPEDEGELVSVLPYKPTPHGNHRGCYRGQRRRRRRRR